MRCTDSKLGCARSLGPISETYRRNGSLRRTDHNVVLPASVIAEAVAAGRCSLDQFPVSKRENGRRQKMWDKGHVVVPVTQRNIDRALARRSSHCTIAMAIQEAIPDARHVAVDLQCVRFTRKSKGGHLRYCFLTPHAARDIIVNTDQGLRDLIRPTVLRMRPAIISRAGKKRNEVPSNSELRGSGLTVNKTQLHLDEADVNPQLDQTNTRLTATGERNLDPDRQDGPARPWPLFHQDRGQVAPPSATSVSAPMSATLTKAASP
jgi:hypothetical protein